MTLNDALSLVCAFVGLIFINHNGISFEFNIGVILTIFAAAFFSIQTIITGNLVKKYVPILISIVELYAASAICLIFSVFTEKIALPVSSMSIFALLFSGIFCSGVAFFLQTYGQKYISPLHTGIIFSTTPVFGIIISHLVCQNALTPFTLVGSVIIIFSIINSNVNIPIHLRYKFKKR
ncbi:MAG: DMT family transporter [Deltaproteobacteria bacterium]